MFYKNILPAQGLYCVTVIQPNGVVRNLFADTYEGAADLVDNYKNDCNVFVSPNTYLSESRKADNTAFSRSFFVDLDVGTDEGKYPSKDKALAGLDAFLTTTGLPPPIRVDSGYGIHAYWVFGSDIEIAEWKLYATKFKQYCLDAGLLIDRAVTADAARIMRCPGTHNFKRDPSVPVEYMDAEGPEYDFAAFKDFLGVEAAPEFDLSLVERGLDNDTVEILKTDNFEYIFTDIAVNSLQGNGCAQIKYILENAKHLPEPLWYAGLSVAVRCTDRDTAIHDMSRDYISYSAEQTEIKAQQSLREATWAHGCDAFNRLNPSVCDGCPHRGKVSSPIRLGRKLREVEFVEDLPVTVDDPFQVIPPSTPVLPGKFALPKALFPYAQGANGGVYYMPPKKVLKDGTTDQDDPVMIFRNDVYPLKRVIGGPEGDALLVRSVVPRDPTKDFMLPIRSVYVQDELKKILPNNGVYPTPNTIQLVAGYFHKWAEYLQEKEQAETMRMQMGWTSEEMEAFVAGGIEIRSDGTEMPSAASVMVKNISKATYREGSYDVWKQSATALGAPGWEMSAFALLCGFASPLMSFTTTPGATICYMSADSGTAKSGSLYAGLSVFCRPKDISVLEGAATDNAYIGRYLGLKNLMFGVDEVSNIDAEDLSKLIHRVSQGKAKLRMQSSVNAERELEQSASMICMMTSNKDLYDVLRTFKGSPDGEMARLIQFTMKKSPEMEQNPARGPQIFEPLHTNFGHAGPEFIKYVYKVGFNYVRQVVNEWRVRTEIDFTDNNAYRFYTSVFSAVFAAGQLANEAGIINYDLNRIYRAVLLEAIQLRDKTAKLNTTDYKALVAEFINKHHTGFLILNEERVVGEPRTALVGRIEVHNQSQYISKTEFKKYLATLQISAREFEFAVEKEGILVDSAKKTRLTSGWKAGMNTPAIYTYHFKTDIPDGLFVNEG
jgi:hypothetical protein